MIANTFYADLERGKMGEKLVKDTFIALGYEIEDKSKDEEFMIQDVDLISADGIKYEVKTDYRFSSTGNLAIEDSVYSFRTQEQYQSWLWTSEADYFCFVNPKDTTKFVTIKADTLRHLVKTESLRTFEKEGGYKITRLFLLPYTKYKELFEIVYTEMS